MKKTKLILAAMPLMMSTFMTSCGSSKINIGILQPVEHEALSLAKEGFVSALKEAGYDDSKINIIYRNAGGKEADQNAFAKDLVSTCDLTLGIGTGAAQALKSASIDKGLIKPVLFTAVTDPVDAGLVESLDNGKGFVTGTSDAQPIDAQIKLIKDCKPEADKIGIFYTQSEVNSVKQAEQAIQSITNYSMSYVTQVATSAADVSSTALALATTPGLDAIYIPTDNNIAANTDAVKTAVRGRNILVVTGEESMLKGCGSITLSISYKELGKTTGKMAARILNKETTAAQIKIATMTEQECEYVMSSVNAQDADVTIPQTIIDKCRDVNE